MDIEANKSKIRQDLLIIEDDIDTLTQNIAQIRTALVDVHTMEDAIAFNEKYDIEEGLFFIRICG